MLLRVADVLALDILKNAGARSLTDTALLEHPVSWVHSSEIPDIARFLRGGELLLTAGLGMGRTAVSQRQFVRDVAAAGAAAIVIEESGRMFHRVPEAVIAEGTQCGLAIVALSEEVPFAGVSAEVHGILSDMRVRTLTREREIEAEFTDLLLHGADTFSLAQALSDTLTATVVVENIAHQIVAHTGDDSEESSDWQRHARASHTDDESCVCRPILTRGQPWGRIHVLRGDLIELPEEAAFAAERAASAIAISLLTDRSREAREGQRTASLVSRLMLGELSGAEFVHQAARLGFRLDRGRATVLVVNKDPREELDTTKLRSHPQALSADMGEYVVVIVPGKGDRPTLDRALSHHTDGIGVSREVDVSMLPAALTQARTAATVARSFGRGQTLHFDALGVERILVTLAEGPDLAHFVEDELGLLLARDAQSSNPLLPTLRAFLAADGRKSEAADALFVQRRTLYNRLDRISEVLGKSLDEPAVRQSLSLAVKGLELLEASGPGVQRPSVSGRTGGINTGS